MKKIDTSDIIRGHRLTDAESRAFFLSDILTSEQLREVERVCKPYLNKDCKTNLNWDEIFYTSSKNPTK